jgi:predicted nuclease of restriction endonuclease-like (RecB) superfamily
MNEITKYQDTNPAYQELLERISDRYIQGQAQAIRSVNESLINTNWNIGKYIVEYEQEGNPKAKYGSRLLENLSRDLILRHGRGFSRSNLNYMRLFYIRYPICETLSHKLSWSHYCEFVKIDDELERSFYYQQNLLDNWSISELKRQKDSGLFMRLALSKDKDEILVEYATYGMSSQLFVSKYQLYLPNKEELRALITTNSKQKKQICEKVSHKLNK